MESNGLIAAYEKILGGKFLPKEDEQQPKGHKGPWAGFGGLGAETSEGASNDSNANATKTNNSQGASSRSDNGPKYQDLEIESGAGLEKTDTINDLGKGKGRARGKGKNARRNNLGKNGQRDFIPDLKKVVQFSDTEGKKHVIGLETYKFKTHRSRHTQVLAEAEEKPFRDYAILLKAEVNDAANGGIKADFSLEIQSDGLKNIFRTIAKRYRELTLDTGDEPIIIEYPFRCLFFLRTKLRELQQAESTPPHLRRELANLVDFIHAPVGHSKIIETYNSLVPHGKINFPMVWTLYPPYEPVLSLHPGQSLENSSCYLVESVSFVVENNKEPYWKIQLLFGYHDGTRFYLKETETMIKWFDGVKDINQDQLDLLPLSLLDEERRNEVRASLIRRGQLYVDYCKRDFSFMHYTGSVDLVTRDSEKQLKALGSKNHTHVDTRVIIDRTAESKISNADDDIGSTVSSCLSEYLATTAERQIALSSGSMPVSGVHQRLRDLVQSDFASGGEGDGHANGSAEGGGGEGGDSSDWILDPKAYAPRTFELTDEDYMICRRTVVGFLLDQKLWVSSIEINGLRKIEWKSDPFQSLQLSSDKKRLVHRLVKGFDGGSQQETYDDLIEGKGKGLIFLLHGPPGLGKTLTAESVAESTRRPLYHVSTGELSIEVHDLERQLSEIFRLGARWNAVVLLDEADVLMSQRTTEDLRRNAIVAVFLRMLEYYRGMLFLTTNRHDDFDNAFYNRIHITIEYGQLTAAWRTNIWREHIQRACRRNRDPLMWSDDRADGNGDSEKALVKGKANQIGNGHDGASEEPEADELLYQALGDVPSNGRDIKNFVRTSLAFARSENEDLGLDQVLIVLENNLSRDVLTSLGPVLERLHELNDRQLQQKAAREARLAKEEDETADET